MTKISKCLNEELILSKYKTIVNENLFNSFYYDLLFKDKIKKTIFIDSNARQILTIESLMLRNVYNNVASLNIRICFLDKVFYYTKNEFLNFNYNSFIDKFYNDFKNYYLIEKEKVSYLQCKFI